MELREVLDRMPTSMWAPSAAEAYARLLARKSKILEEGLPFYERIERDYRDSPYLAFALREKARLYADSGRNEEAVKSYEDLMHRRPDNPFKSEALHYLVGSDLGRGDLAKAEVRTGQWIALAPIYDKFNAYVAMAEILSKKGDAAGAKQAAKNAMKAIQEFRNAAHAGSLPGARGQATKWEHDAVEAEQKARALMQ
jgi:tetratricopeptide (TPR) repeat protein